MEKTMERAGQLISWGTFFVKYPYLLILIVVLLVPFLVLPFAMIGGLFSSEQGKGAPVSGVKYAAEINAAAAKHGVDPSLLAAVIQQESGGNPNAVSSAGAVGVMQIMPENAAGADLTDPAENIDRGAEILAGHLKKYDGNLAKALAAYNAGPGAVAKYGGVPPYPETQNYVQNITANYQTMRQETLPNLIKKGRGLSVPVANATISSKYGPRNGGFHRGQDFAAPVGTPILAAGSGVVESVQTPTNNSRLGPEQSYGTLVVIDHGGGLKTRYAHMYPYQIKVKPGQRVQRGAIIGAVGDFGNSTGPHLHFEVRKEGKAMDPATVLKGKPIAKKDTPSHEKGDKNDVEDSRKGLLGSANPDVPDVHPDIDPILGAGELLKRKGEPHEKH